MTRVFIKPLSVNECWKGRRFKSKAYSVYEKQVLLTLKPIKLPPAPYELKLKFGFSSKASDWDNCIKPLQDCLAKKYKFNDKLIRRGVVETEIVAKGKEFFEFEITTFNHYIKKL